jgi:hypothetical protein
MQKQNLGKGTKRKIFAEMILSKLCFRTLATSVDWKLDRTARCNTM